MRSRYGGRVNFVVVNGDDPRNGGLVQTFGVDGVPHLALISAERKLQGTLIGDVPDWQPVYFISLCNFFFTCMSFVGEHIEFPASEVQ